MMVGMFRRKPSPPPVRTAEVYPIRCNCPGYGFEGCHGGAGYRLGRCEENEARWWMASISESGRVLWNDRYDTRAEAETALIALSPDVSRPQPNNGD